MAYTYDPTAAANKDKVRGLIGDTGTTAATAIFEDREITMYLDIASNNVFKAAALACRACATSRAKDAFRVNIEGGMDLDRKGIAAMYRDMAKDFEKQALSQPECVAEEWQVKIDEVTGEDTTTYADFESDE